MASTNKAPVVALGVLALLGLLWYARQRVVLREHSVSLHESSCSDPRRIGHAGDGGWWICGDGIDKAVAKGDCTAYSFGIKDDWSFDEMMGETCNVRGFDPSPAGLASKPAYERAGKGFGSRTYHSWGLAGVSKVFKPGEAPFRWPGIDFLWSVNTLSWELLTVGDTMKRLGNSRIDVLKVDTEGAEWDALNELLTGDVIKKGSVGQFCVEFHFDPEIYSVQGDPHGGGGFTVSQHKADNLDILGILQTLENQGMHMWRWKFNVADKRCVEASYVFHATA